LNRQGAKDAKKDKYRVGMMEPGKELDELANSVIGAAIEVHRCLGPGYLENVYDQALGIELLERKLPFQRQHPISIVYKGQTIGGGRLDLLVSNQLVVELKAVDVLLPVHKAQVISYLKATGLKLGLLINFNVSVLRNGLQRIIYSK
jgi:GxxExxY protein